MLLTRNQPINFSGLSVIRENICWWRYVSWEYAMQY